MVVQVMVQFCNSVQPADSTTYGADMRAEKPAVASNKTPEKPLSLLTV